MFSERQSEKGSRFFIAIFGGCNNDGAGLKNNCLQLKRARALVCRMWEQWSVGNAVYQRGADTVSSACPNTWLSQGDTSLATSTRFMSNATLPESTKPYYRSNNVSSIFITAHCSVIYPHFQQIQLIRLTKMHWLLLPSVNMYCQQCHS